LNAHKVERKRKQDGSVKEIENKGWALV